MEQQRNELRNFILYTRLIICCKLRLIFLTQVNTLLFSTLIIIIIYSGEYTRMNKTLSLKLKISHSRARNKYITQCLAETVEM